MKSMKKSMVVTTVLMVLLLIVALSTATFAWYTAQSNATVTQTTVTSAKSSSASLVIDATAATSSVAKQSTVDITMTSEIMPAMLNSASAPTAGTTALSDFKFVTYTLDNGGKYASAPSEATVATITKVVGSSEVTGKYFYVTNVGGVETDVNATVTIDANYYAEVTVAENATLSDHYILNADNEYEKATGTAVAGTTYYQLKSNEFLRVAMFVDDVYQGTWALSDNSTVMYAEIATDGADQPAVGDEPADHSSFSATASGSSLTVATALGSMKNIKVTLVAWFEGDQHTNMYAGTGALFTVVFGGE